MGCDKTENVEPDPTSFHGSDDPALSSRQSGAVDYNGVIQGGFSSGANVTSSPFVSLPAGHPLPGHVNEMNNFEMANLMSLNTLHHHHLETNLMNVRNISPSFCAPLEMPNCMENGAEINHSNMNNNMPTPGSLMDEGVFSKEIQNSGAKMNFMPTPGCFKKVGKATGISQNSLKASGSPKSIGEVGIHNDAKVNPVPIPSPEKTDCNFLSLGIVSNLEDSSNLRFSGKEVSSRLEEAVLPQSNNSHVQQMRINFPSLTHGVPGGITNFQHYSGGLPNSARNSGVSTCSSNNDQILLAPGSRMSAPPFMYITPDARLNSSNTRNLRLSEPNPFNYAQGGLPPSPLPFHSNSTLSPHLGFGRMAAAPESAQPVRVAARPTIMQQSNLYTNISRNQSFMGSPILSHGGGRVWQDHLGQQFFVNAPYPWGNNLFPEGMGAQVAGWSGIQPAPGNQSAPGNQPAPGNPPVPGNQFPMRLGVQLNAGAISQATREGVLPGMGGIQQTRRGQPQSGSPAKHNVSGLPYHTGSSPAKHNVSGLPYHTGSSPAKHNFSGLPYHTGQGVPLSKVDVTPPISLKRRGNGAPPTAPTSQQRKRRMTQVSNQQLIAHQRQIASATVPASSSHVKGQGLEEPAQPVGEKCRICKRNLVFNPEGPISRPAIPPPVAVLPCGHVFHDHCLQNITPQDQSKDPPCIPCALGET